MKFLALQLFKVSIQVRRNAEVRLCNYNNILHQVSFVKFKRKIRFMNTKLKLLQVANAQTFNTKLNEIIIKKGP